MSKAKIIDKKSVDSILGEKNLLSELHHPFIVNMVYSFQDHDYLYLVMDLLPGGNLRYHLTNKHHFSEKQNKFLIGCILVGLEYIHGENILHRDIKPENLVFDNNGYLRITDFGIAKKYVVNNKKDTSGTVGYLAPEVLCNENHTFSIDYYAIGIITYELAYGHRPYIGKTKHEVKQLILTRQAHVDYDDLPDGYENEAADFINRLIQRKPKNRLGRNGIKEVINHSWLKGFDWEKMKDKSLQAYYIPKEGDNYDKKYCLQSNKIGTDTMERYKQIANEPNYDIIFKNFDCNKIPDELKINIDNYKIGDIINNNANISSNNSTTSISRNNKITFNINNNKEKDKDKDKDDNKNNKNKNTNSLLGKQRNKSMENIFANQNADKINISKNKNNKNENKSLIKQISAININVNKDNIINDILDKEKSEDNKNIKKISSNNTNNIKSDKEIQKKEYKIIFNKKKDHNIMNKFSFRKKYNNNEHKEIIKLKDKDILYNHNINNYKDIKPNISNNIKEKNYLIDNFGELSNINENQSQDKDKEKLKEKDKEPTLYVNNSQKITNLNKYISNNYKQNSINKSNKLLSNSNSSINILSSELFANIKGNYFKKIINNKLLNKDSNRIKNKDNNSLIGSNSTKSLFKNNSNSNVNEKYIIKSKKQFLKKELFNGTFYPNKSVSTKYFLVNQNKGYKKRKSSASLINKKIEMNNNKLSSSSSLNYLIHKKYEGKDGENVSGIYSNNEVKINSNEDKNYIHNIDKKLPFINMALNNKAGSIFRNNLHFINRNHLNNKNNGFFSERLKNNESTKLKSSISGSLLNKK